MKVGFFDAHKFDKNVFEQVNKNYSFEFVYFDTTLDSRSSVLASGLDAVCCFVNDHLDRETLKILSETNVRIVALRCAGFNNVDLDAAKEFGIKIVRVPKYSPFAVAEHATALILCLNRKIHKAYNRVRDHNFSLDGLVGHDINGKTVGILGAGQIGSVFAKIMNGLGCEILVYDKYVNDELVSKYSCKYVELDELFSKSDIISLHLPLNKDTVHVIDKDAIARMKNNVMLINTGRGGLVDSGALLWALKNEKIGYAGLDVYEEEEEVFFKDVSDYTLKDDCLARLLTFPNVIITSHQAFLTCEALENIAKTTMKSLDQFHKGESLNNEVTKSS